MPDPEQNQAQYQSQPRVNPEAEAIRRNVWLTVFAAMAIAFSVAPIVNDHLNRGNKDYVLWYYTGRAVSQGADVYPKDGRVFPFMYPPSCAAMLAILSQVGETPFVWLLVAINTAAWAGCIALSVYLATGRFGSRQTLLYVAPSLIVVAYVHDAYLLGQPHILLLACMLGAFACLGRGRAGVAGSLVALAAAIKAFPFMAIGYLVYRRAWKATAAMVVALTLLMVVLPMPFRGIRGAYEDVGTWTQGMVLRYDAGGIAQRPERGFGFKNQSLMALANRLLRDIPADGESRDGWKVNLVSLGFSTVNKIILGMALLLGGLYVALMPWRATRSGTTAAIEGALLLLLILLFSPLSFNYAFVWLLYPLTLALHLGLESPPRSAGRRLLVGSVVATAVSLGLSIVSSRLVAGYGNSTIATMILFASLGWRLAVEPGANSPIQWAGALIRRGISKQTSTPLNAGHAAPPAPHSGVMSVVDRDSMTAEDGRSR